MPRLDPGERSKKWKIKTDPKLLTPKLASIHELASEKIAVAFDSIDRLYDAASAILDKYGISTNERLLYRCFMEEMYKVKRKYSGTTLKSSANAIAMKYVGYGCNLRALIEIANLTGVTLELPNSKILTFGLGYP